MSESLHNATLTFEVKTSDGAPYYRSVLFDYALLDYPHLVTVERVMIEVAHLLNQQLGALGERALREFYPEAWAQLQKSEVSSD